MADAKSNNKLRKEMGLTKKSDTVQVVVRVRPLNKKEKQTGCTQIVNTNPETGLITIGNPNGGGKDPPKQYVEHMF